MDPNTPFDRHAQFVKYDPELGLVFGWAIVCCENGVEYFDTQNDHIPESSMLKAATDFMESARMAGEQHERMSAGTVLFAMPMTKEVAKAFGVTTERTGLMIAMRPDESMLKKFKSGELTGFSIGGMRGIDQEA